MNQQNISPANNSSPNQAPSSRPAGPRVRPLPGALEPKRSVTIREWLNHAVFALRAREVTLWATTISSAMFLLLGCLLGGCGGMLLAKSSRSGGIQNSVLPDQMPLAAYIRSGPREPKTFRLQCQLDNLYSSVFTGTQASNYSVRLSEPEGEEFIHGFVFKHTDDGKRLHSQLKDGKVYWMTLDIMHQGENPRWVVITKVHGK